MLSAERKNYILEQLQKDKKVIVSELSRHFHVSEETIRRDLDKLDREGLASKCYGGATLNDGKGMDMPFGIRKNKNISGKQKIADLVGTLVEDGDHLLLDPSSTALFVARSIKGKKNLTVVTNSMEVILELANREGIHTICTGGEVQGDYLGLAGAQTVRMIENFQVDKAILSCKGFDLEYGMTEANLNFAMVKQAMIRHAKTVILAVDSSKFGQTAFARVCEAGEIDILVTDEKPAEEVLDQLQEKGVTCLYPEMLDN